MLLKIKRIHKQKLLEILINNADTAALFWAVNTQIILTRGNLHKPLWYFKNYLTIHREWSNRNNIIQDIIITRPDKIIYYIVLRLLKS